MSSSPKETLSRPPRVLFSSLSAAKHLILNNRIYNIENFSHPGGPVILSQALKRRCAWELFVSHHRTDIVENYEDYLPENAFVGYLQEERLLKVDLDHEKRVKDELRNPGTSANQEMVQNCSTAGALSPAQYKLQMEGKYQHVYSSFYATLKKRVEHHLSKSNKSHRDQPLMYLKAFLSLLVYIFLYVLLYFSHTVRESMLLTVMLAIGWGWSTANIGMNIMHDGNHGAFSNRWYLNSLTGYSFDFMGGSSFVWRMIHTNGHHVNTNVEEKDPDIHTNEPHFRRIRDSQKWHFWYWFQPFYLPIMYSTLIFEFAFRDFAAMILGAWGGTIFQEVSLTEWIVFLLVKLWYVGYQFVVPRVIIGLSWSHIALVYCLCSMVGSEILVCMFQVNHVTDKAEMTHCDEDTFEVPHDWASFQIRGSTDFAPGSWFWNHFSGGLNHQIEHHLFPSMSHVHYPAIQPIVEQTCEEFGVPYRYYDTFWDALRGHFRVLWRLSCRPSSGSSIASSGGDLNLTSQKAKFNDKISKRESHPDS
eukprot:CAMPEP_0117437580 /NCGR_PEP_ID=MMETSP0759-20121206/1596_1 /TAXON_ID=63605 /ORGANISM="Percolomonas cosmopolitus, Strain WS" /LENGTH=530 /DNA_ID=CAMNT_0005229215 /DNA_START=29 /DNA_END=1619 /DNA_ORIENTATION=+